MSAQEGDFVFAPLGGLGEIGMNAALYGFGPPQKRKWIMVDCGLTFPGPDLPGVDLVMPDLAFIDKIRPDLLGLLITHAHEDHIGAVAALWPKLNCPVYATRFAAGLLEMRRLGEAGAPDVDIRIVAAGQTLDLGPFSVEYVSVSHSVPEASALAIRTPAGLALHTGDWKIDREPGVGSPIDEARLRQLGDAGVDVMICDSTNILREGESFSESEVARTLLTLIGEARGRVLVTTFSSNIQRIRAIAEAAAACGRSVIVAGRAMDRAIQVARECGFLDGVAGFYALDMVNALPRDKTVIIATGSQGEARAAMSRAAHGDHPMLKLAHGDRVIFSSRTIPGNALDVNRVVNRLCDIGVEVLTDHDHLVHCSGHPRRGEVAKMYAWVRPKAAIPAHGEPHHLTRHLAFAKEQGVETVVSARNGDLVRLAPGKPSVIGQIPAGRVLKDGDVFVAGDDSSIRDRQKLAFAGVVSIALSIDKRGDLVGVPDMLFAGLPQRGKDGAEMAEAIDDAVFRTFDGLSRPRRRDFDAVSTAIERAVRGAVNAVWGKKPLVHVLVVGG